MGGAAAKGRLCCKSRRYLVRSRKTGNIRIRRVEFLNQNSLFGLDLEKVFFARGLKIVLQHYRPQGDMRPSSPSRRCVSGAKTSLSVGSLVGCTPCRADTPLRVTDGRMPFATHSS